MIENPQVTRHEGRATAQEPSTPRGDAQSPRGIVGAIPQDGGTPQDIGRHQLTVALTWKSRGFPVVPCSRTTKGALVAGFGAKVTSEGIARFADRQQIERWWTKQFRGSQVGLLTGRGENGGLVVIDLDIRKLDSRIGQGPNSRWEDVQGGTDVLEELASDAGAPWPETYTVLTPSGGMHLYYLQPPDGPPIGCATGDGDAGPHLGPLIDVRGLGGYVIAAGSYSSAQGRPYTRVTPPDLLPQPLPGWLLALLRRPAPERPHPALPTCHAPGRRATGSASRAERYAEAALRGAVEDLAALRDGDQRRNRTYAAAARLAELSATAPHILTESAVHEQLLAAALASGIKGGQRQAEKCIRNGWEQGLSGRRAGAA